jgi:uncharacterized protein (DUF2062 family)
LKPFLSENPQNIKKGIATWLTTGLEPDKIALTFSLGLVIGIIPVFGLATILCLAISRIFRLNMAIIQFANFISTPLMLATIMPFYKFGNLLLRSVVSGNYEPVKLNWNDPELLFWEASWSVAGALMLWAVLAPFAVLILYTIFQQIIHKVKIRSVHNFFIL